MTLPNADRAVVDDAKMRLMSKSKSKTKLVPWLNRHTAVDQVVVGPLEDAWYGPTMRASYRHD